MISLRHHPLVRDLLVGTFHSTIKIKKYLVSEFSCDSRQSLIWFLNNFIHWLQKERERNKIIVRAFPRITRSQLPFRQQQTSNDLVSDLVSDLVYCSCRLWARLLEGHFSMLLCSWTIHLTLSAPLSTPVYKWLPGSKFSGKLEISGRYLWSSGMGKRRERVLTNQIQVASYQKT